jgi:hypothetical protein
MAKDIYIQLEKPWGGFAVGQVVRFGYTKGTTMLKVGLGRKVRKQACVNEPAPMPKRGPVVERAVAPPPAEKEVVTPEPAPVPEPQIENDTEIEAAPEPAAGGIVLPDETPDDPASTTNQ